MEASDELLTIAELAITLTGFSGVVAAFGQNRGLRKDERFFFIALVIVAISTVFLAFVPFIYNYAGVTGEAIWTYSSATMLAVITIQPAVRIPALDSYDPRRVPAAGRCTRFGTSTGMPPSLAIASDWAPAPSCTR